MAARKKQEIKTEEKPAEANPVISAEVTTAKEEVKAEPVIVSDVITETIVIEETPEAAKTETSESFSSDPLSNFKERVDEELNMPDSPTKKNYMWPILFIFVVAIVLLVGIFAYKQGIFKKTIANVTPVTPTPVVTVAPTAAAVDLTKYEVEILNGSGVDGEASKEKSVLVAAGFTVSSIGNADNSDYTDTIIKAQAQVDQNFIAKLKNTLSNMYTVGDTQILSSDAAVPVQVILGPGK